MRKNSYKQKAKITDNREKNKVKIAQKKKKIKN